MSRRGEHRRGGGARDTGIWPALGPRGGRFRLGGATAIGKGMTASEETRMAGVKPQWSWNILGVALFCTRATWVGAGLAKGGSCPLEHVEYRLGGFFFRSS